MSWSNQDERNYIDGLVSGRWVEHGRPIDPVKLLKNYLRSIKKRDYWGTLGTMDYKIIKGYAAGHLERLL